MMRPRWMRRDVPLPPTVVVGRGEAAARLGARLLQMGDDDVRHLRGVAGPGWLLLEGEVERLPWSDGVLYLGVDPQAPSLRLPTTATVDVPLPLFERAVLARTNLAPPVAVVDDAMLSLARALPVAHEAVREWLERERG